MIEQLVEEMKELALTPDNIIKMMERSLPLDYNEFYRLHHNIMDALSMREVQIRKNQQIIDLELIKAAYGYSMPLKTSSLKIGDSLLCCHTTDNIFNFALIFLFEVISIEGLNNRILYKIRHQLGSKISVSELKITQYYGGQCDYFAEYKNEMWKIIHCDTLSLSYGKCCFFIKNDINKKTESN